MGEAALGALGDVASAGINYAAQSQTNAANMAQQQQLEQYQTQMSDTAYQREVEDLQQAGLNTMLAFPGAGGASTPSGAMADITSPTTGLSSSAKSMVQDALDAKSKKADIELTEAKTNTENATRPEQVKMLQAQATKAVNESKFSGVEGTVGDALGSAKRGVKYLWDQGWGSSSARSRSGPTEGKPKVATPIKPADVRLLKIGDKIDQSREP